MLKIAHRQNTIAELKATPIEFGVEIDLRSEGNDIILHHDAFQKGEKFEEWLKHYAHAFLILNTKAEGLEEKIIALISNHSISNYFFLDLSIPFMIKQIKKGNKNIAVRYSEYEPLALSQKFQGLVDWVWVDCFKDWSLSEHDYRELKKHFKLCLVAPELQGHPPSKTEEFKNKLKQMPFDAVCTKKPEQW